MAMLSVEEAEARVLSLCAPLEAEAAAIDEAIDRALAEDVAAARTLPPWDNSAMDGYALRHADLASGRPLAVTQTIFAGQAPTKAVGAFECARIMTGAALPPGADTVVMQERVSRSGDAITVAEVPAPGANVRRRGEDVEAGVKLFSAGTPVGLAEAGALWAQGLTAVRVHRRPTVAIAASGDELAPVGTPPGDRIVDTNSPVIAAAARRAGALVTPLGLAADRLDALEALFARGLEHDVLITVAGASVGERDFTRDAFERLGVSLDFFKVAMKPGKPLAVGRKGKTLIFGLPGNPVSAMVTFERFVRPALRRLQGLPPGPRLVPGRAAVALSGSPTLRLFVRAHAVLRDGALWATPLSSQSSGAMASATGATHLVSLPPGTGTVTAGSEIELLELTWLRA
ncbi:MAG: gephyrin-like molybdotransferase Glp [Myxococcota bacterium]